MPYKEEQKACQRYPSIRGEEGVLQAGGTGVEAITQRSSNLEVVAQPR